MIKKIFLALLPLLFCSFPAGAQTGPRKVLVVISDYSEIFRTGYAIGRALQLKEAGLDVQVIFEGEGVVNFVDYHGVPDTPAWKQKAKDVADSKAKRKKDPAGGKVIHTSPDRKILEKDVQIGAFLKSLLQSLKDKKIPYTLCSRSALVLGVYADLAAAGEPLSPDTGKVIDLSPYVKDNYYVFFSS